MQLIVIILPNIVIILGPNLIAMILFPLTPAVTGLMPLAVCFRENIVLILLAIKKSIFIPQTFWKQSVWFRYDVIYTVDSGKKQRDDLSFL